MRHVRLAQLGLLGFFAIAGCDRSAKLGPPSIATALRLAREDLDLPDARNVEPEIGAGVIHVVVSRSRVSVLGDPFPVATIPKDPALGFSAEDKRDGRSAVTITPLAQALEWARKNPTSGERVPMISQLVIVADASTPYRMISEVVASAGPDYQIAFAARTGDRAKPVGILPLAVPSLESLAVNDKLEVRLTDSGIAVSYDKKTVATGCKDVGPGPAVPRAASREVELGQLATCLAEMINARAESKGERIAIAGESETKLSVFVKLLETVRAAGFSNVELVVRWFD